MRIPQVGRSADYPDYFQASQFLNRPGGRIFATWSHGIPTILPPCTHVAIGFMIPRTPQGVFGDVTWLWQFIPRADMAAIASRWWYPLDAGFVRIEGCPEEEWLQLYRRSSEFDVGPPSSSGGIR